MNNTNINTDTNTSINDSKISISQEVKEKIQKDLLEKDYYNSIKNLLCWKNIFFSCDRYFQILIDILHASSIVTGSLAIPLGYENLTLASIVLNIGSMTAKILHHCSKVQTTESVDDINTLCKNIGINNQIPDLTKNEIGEDNNENSNNNGVRVGTKVIDIAKETDGISSGIANNYGSISSVAGVAK